MPFCSLRPRLRTRYRFLRYSIQKMPGRVYTELLDLAQDQHGYLRTEDVRKAGLDPKRLVDYERRGVAERVAYGVYRMKAMPPDELEEYMRAALWPMGVGVLSHETALDLYELCDVNPASVDVTVPRRYRTHRPVPALYRLHPRDLASKLTTKLRGLPIVTPLRAILDGIEAHVRGELIEQAIQTAEQQTLITHDGATRARSALAAKGPLAARSVGRAARSSTPSIWDCDPPASSHSSRSPTASPRSCTPAPT
jgi:predicted transcriptional regulator of viral defense system